MNIVLNMLKAENKSYLKKNIKRCRSGAFVVNCEQTQRNNQQIQCFIQNYEHAYSCFNWLTHDAGLFLHPLKTLENLLFFGGFQGV